MMPHVDDGTLHALLDGGLRAEEPARADAVEAHLETCADCRARLEHAAALRDRSAEVLAVLEPSVAPDFDEVLVRAGGASGAGAGRRGLARQARWTRGLAWAATIAIALGTGYLIRDRLAPERVLSGSGDAVLFDTASEAPRGAPTDGGGGEPDMAARDAADRTGAVEGGVGGTEEPRIRADAERAPIAATSPAAPRPGVAEPAAAEAEAEDQPVPANTRQLARRVDDVDSTAAAAARPDATESPAVGAIAAAPPPPPAPPLGSPAETAAVRAESLAAPPQPGERAIALSELVVTGVAPARDEAAWPVTLAEAAELLGGPLLVLPGAGVTTVLARTGARGPEISSVQRLADGTEVRVTQRRAPVLPEALRARRSELREAAAAAPAPPPSPARRAREPLGRPADAVAALQARDTRVRTVRVVLADAELELAGPLPSEALRVLGEAAAPHDGGR